LGLKLSDTRVYEPQIRARLGTAAHLCEVVVPKWRQVKQRIAIDKMDRLLRQTPCLEGTCKNVQEGDPVKMVVDFVLLPPLPGDDSGVQRYTFSSSLLLSSLDLSDTQSL